MIEHRRTRHKFLLVTSDTLGGLDGGSILFRSLLERLNAHDVAWIACGASDASIPAWMVRFPRLVFTSPMFHRYVRAAAVRSVLRRTYFDRTLVAFPNRVKHTALQFARSHAITKIWVHASGPAIFLARWLATELDVPVHTSLQDDPGGHDEVIGDVLGPHFAGLLKQTTGADVASDAMKWHYDSQYNLDLNARTIRFGNIKASLPPRPKIRPRGRRIAYAGNIWSLDAMTAFCDAVEDLSAGPARDDPFTVTIFSEKEPRSLRRYRSTSYGGLVPSDQMALVLSDFDLVYCPMGFGDHHRMLTKLSFPAKIFTYLQAQVPIVAHGPDYATHTEFVMSNELGLVLQTLDRTRLASMLAAYGDDVGARERHSSNARTLITGPLSPARVAAELMDFVDQ